ncbi:MAG: hypothetical protein P4L50_26990 [Anaerolineaceae bacterium]|nr:hypothetical protein [Anaerolineaceae bacterium]
MSETWYEDALSVSETALGGVSRKIARSIKSEIQPVADELAQAARGIVRAQKPDWKLLKPAEMKNVLDSGQKSRYFKVRLIFEFEIPKKNFDRGARFVFARCDAAIRSMGGPFLPEVYDLYPQDLYEGEQQKVSLKFAPSITADKLGVSIGEIGTDIALGQIAPVVVGYFGDQKQEPHWELRPKSKSLLGRQYLWLVLSLPEGCQGIQLFSRVEAEIQTKYGPIAVGPKTPAWDDRPFVVIR